MFVKALEPGTTKINDIQIQTSVHRLCFDLTLAKDIYGGNADVMGRLRIMNAKDGVVQLMDIMSLLHRLEIESSGKGEGAFIYSRNDDGTYHMKGSFIVGKDGALVLRGGVYASLDLDVNTKQGQSITGTISTIDHWRGTSTAVCIEPFTVNGTTKDISLGGVNALAVRPALLSELTIRQNGRAVEFTGEELTQLALINNDIVSVDDNSGTAVFGIKMFMVLGVEDAVDCKITPALTAPEQFAQYVIKDVNVIL